MSEDARIEIDRIMKMYERGVNPARVRLLKLMGIDDVEVEAEGALIRTAGGKTFIDCLGGIGVFNVGHRHPKVVAAVRRELERMPVATRVLLSRPLAELAERLEQVTPGALQYTFPVHSGAAAVEAALKLARASTGRTEIIATVGAFHGKTFGALSASGKDFFKKPFEPLVPGFVHVPYGDAEAVKRAIGAQTAAVIVEPVQGEAGVIVPPDGYMRELRAACDEAGALLIADEVQTGLGRTGRLFACEHDGVAPDILCLAKALGGGIYPLGAVVATADAFQPLLDDPYLHTTTIESPAAFAAASACLDVIEEEGLVEHTQQIGDWFLQRLRELQSVYTNVIAEVRGRGLMIGVSFQEPGQGAVVMGSLLANSVLVAFTLNNPEVMRFEPPLVISKEQLEEVLSRLETALKEASALA